MYSPINIIQDMHNNMIKFNIVNLVSDKTDSLNKISAITTLANLSCTHSNHETMFNLGIVPILLYFIDKNKSKIYRDELNINLIELCRHSAFILANLTTLNGFKIIEALGSYNLVMWLDGIRSYHDYTVRSWLLRIKIKLNILN